LRAASGIASFIRAGVLKPQINDPTEQLRLNLSALNSGDPYSYIRRYSKAQQRDNTSDARNPKRGIRVHATAILSPVRLSVGGCSFQGRRAYRHTCRRPPGGASVSAEWLDTSINAMSAGIIEGMTR
jgi:hypothetical protein